MTIFTSRTARGLMFALLLLGGSVQAVSMTNLFRPSTPATSALTLVQHKSFFASHPVLKWGGIGLGAGAAVFLGVEGYRAWKNNVNFFRLLKKDFGFVNSQACKFAFWMTPVQRRIKAVQAELNTNQALREKASGVELARLETQAQSLLKEVDALETIDQLEREVAPLQKKHDKLMDLSNRTAAQEAELTELHKRVADLDNRLEAARNDRDAVSAEETAKF